MSVETFIPALWAADLLESLRDEHRYGNCVNRDYQGEIKGMGSSVVINTPGPVTVRNYSRNTALATPDTLVMADQILTIDQGKYFRTMIDNVDKVQARADLRAAFMREAADAIADTMDDFISALINTAVDGTANDLTNGTPLTVGQGAGEIDMYGLLVKMGKVLDESNTPKNGRWIVVPAFAEAQTRLDNRFVGFGTTPSQSRAFSGKPIAEAAGFTLYMSNRTPAGGSSSKVILGGYKGAVTFAEQIEEMRAFQHPDYFAEVVQELHVYGGKVTRPSNIVAAEVLEGEYY